MSIALILLGNSSGNLIVYENMTLGEEKPLLMFYKRVLHDPSPGVPRKIKYLGMGVRRPSEKA